MTKSRVNRSLYRSLLKMAKSFDNSPSSKALLYRKTLENSGKNSASIYYTNILDKLFEKKSYLFQPKGEFTSLAQLVRSESREFSENINVKHSDRLDAGFAVLRKLSILWKSFGSITDDNNEYETEIGEEEEVNVQVALSTTLASGTLLLAHPMLQGPLHRSVILLLEHNSKGSYGKIL